VVLQIDGKPLIDGLALIEKVRASPDKELRLTILRAGLEKEITAKPRGEEVQGKLIGRLRVEISAMPELQEVRHDFLPALGLAVQETWDTSVMTVKMMGKMLTGQVSLKNLTGPITIADYAGQTAKIGWISYLNFIAFISLSLGVMNLLPIPVLDGGHLLYYSLEILMGRPLSERMGELAQRAGLGILMMLMAIALFNDIASRLP
jgi:regulator of sigma E protease